MCGKGSSHRVVFFPFKIGYLKNAHRVLNLVSYLLLRLKLSEEYKNSLLNIEVIDNRSQ